MLKALAGGMVLAAIGTPAMADSFWVIQDSATKACSVVEQDQKPATTSASVLGNAYPSRAEAERAMKVMVQCGRTE